MQENYLVAFVYMMKIKKSLRLREYAKNKPKQINPWIRKDEFSIVGHRNELKQRNSVTIVKFIIQPLSI